MWLGKGACPKSVVIGKGCVQRGDRCGHREGVWLWKERGVSKRGKMGVVMGERGVSKRDVVIGKGKEGCDLGSGCGYGVSKEGRQVKGCQEERRWLGV